MDPASAYLFVLLETNPAVQQNIVLYAYESPMHAYMTHILVMNRGP